MILLGAVVATITRWRWAVAFGALAWPIVLVFTPDFELALLPAGVQRVPRRGVNPAPAPGE